MRNKYYYIQWWHKTSPYDNQEESEWYPIGAPNKEAAIKKVKKIIRQDGWNRCRKKGSKLNWGDYRIGKIEIENFDPYEEAGVWLLEPDE